MFNHLLVGWEAKVQWEDDEIESFFIVEDNEKIAPGQIRCDTVLAKELLDCKIGEEKSFFVDKFENKFKLLELTNKNIQDTIFRHNLTKIYHFTSLSNLPSILKNGILSKDQLVKQQIEFEQNDNLRLDNMTDFISCSLEYPNNKLLYKNKYSLHKDYCLIEIDIDILNHVFSACSTTNAASKSGKNIMSISYIERLFNLPRPKSLPINFPTDEQAEILIKSFIPLSFVKSIIFENSFDYNKCANLFPSNIKTTINGNMFSVRGQYE